MRALERKSGKINGENMAKMKKSVTMSDIAERLEVSTVTVSKALSGQKGVSEEIASIAEKDAKSVDNTIQRIRLKLKNLD